MDNRKTLWTFIMVGALAIMFAVLTAGEGVCADDITYYSLGAGIDTTYTVSGDRYVAIRSDRGPVVAYKYSGGSASDSLKLGETGTANFFIGDADSLVFESIRGAAGVTVITGSRAMPFISKKECPIKHTRALSGHDATSDIDVALIPDWDETTMGKVFVMVRNTGITSGATPPSRRFYRTIDEQDTTVAWIEGGTNKTSPQGFSDGDDWVRCMPLSLEHSLAAPDVFIGDSLYFDYDSNDATAGEISVYVWTKKE